MMNEMLCGIRVLKFYAWESLFTNRIQEIRGKELQSLKGRKYLDALCVYFWATTPVLISILTFTTYALLGHQLTAAKVDCRIGKGGGRVGWLAGCQCLCVCWSVTVHWFLSVHPPVFSI